jgi:hypothetical protein
VSLNVENKKANTLLKNSLLIVAISFFTYSIYWFVNGIIWGYTITQWLLNINQFSNFSSIRTGELIALFVQEYSSFTNSFVILASGILSLQGGIFYLKHDPMYLKKFRWLLFLTALFSLLLVPSSVHHLLGVTYGWRMVDIYVGLSYLLQPLLIVPPLLILRQKMLSPQRSAEIKKWATIAGPCFTLALWLKYLFLWIDTLSPMNTQATSPISTIGTINCFLTLLIASILIIFGCINLYKDKSNAKYLIAMGVFIIGFFFLIYSVVAIFVPIYASFWYLTDFWMLILLIPSSLYLTNGFKNNNLIRK